MNCKYFRRTALKRKAGLMPASFFPFSVLVSDFARSSPSPAPVQAGEENGIERYRLKAVPFGDTSKSAVPKRPA